MISSPWCGHCYGYYAQSMDFLFSWFQFTLSILQNLIYAIKVVQYHFSFKNCLLYIESDQVEVYYLSWVKLVPGWHLHFHIAQAVSQLWDQLEMDLLASSCTHQCQLHFTLE